MPSLPHASRRQSHPSRAAFAFGGWVMLLFLVLIGVCIVNSYLTWSRLPPPGRGAYQAGFRLGIWFVPVIVPLVALGIGWLVGKLVALMFGNSDDAGNIGASVILLSLIALFGYGIYTSSTAPLPPPNTASSSISTTPPDPPALTNASDAATRLAEEQKAQLRSMQDRNQQNLDAMREASRKQIGALRNSTPALIQPSTLPAPNTSPAAKSPNATPSTPAAASLNPNIQPVIDTFEKDLDAKIDTLITLSSKTVPTLQRTPPHDAGRIKSRLDEAESLRTAADAVKRSLDQATESLTSKLEGAGIPASEAHTAAFRWSGFDYKAATRGFAASSLIRIADKTREECEYLTDNLGKWTLDSHGDVKCDDFQTKSKINSLRFFVKAEADRRTSIEDQLRGR